MYPSAEASSSAPEARQQSATAWTGQALPPATSVTTLSGLPPPSSSTPVELSKASLERLSQAMTRQEPASALAEKAREAEASAEKRAEAGTRAAAAAVDFVVAAAVAAAAEAVAPALPPPLANAAAAPTTTGIRDTAYIFGFAAAR